VPSYYTPFLSSGLENVKSGKGSVCRACRGKNYQTLNRLRESVHVEHDLDNTPDQFVALKALGIPGSAAIEIEGFTWT